MNKKLMSLILVGILGFGMIGCNNTEKEEERLNSAMELLEQEMDKNLTLYTVEGSTKIILEETTMETNKSKLAFDKQKKEFCIVWDILIDCCVEDNDKMNEILVNNGYEDIVVLSYIIDEDGEIIAEMYNEKVYYDVINNINEIEELEEKFNLSIDIK